MDQQAPAQAYPAELPTDRGRQPFYRDFNSANIAAGVTATLWYAFGAIPVFLGVVAALGLPAEIASSWFFIIFLTSGLTSIPLSLHFRQPLAVGWTIPGLVFLGVAGTQHSFPEVLGANFVAGAIILLLGLTGLASRLMRWIPLPIILGMFAGSVLGYATAIFESLTVQPIVVAAALLGFLGARGLNLRWLPPVAGATVLGLIGAGIVGGIQPEAFVWAAPSVRLIWPEWNVSSIVAISLPLVVLALGAGNVQGLGLLISQGYRPPIALVTSIIGVNSMIHALFGGHSATIQRAGTAIVGGEDAGPVEQRYIANVIASVGALLLAASSATASTLLGVLPAGLIAALAGLAIFSTLLDAVRRATSSDLPLGAFFALAIAASPLTILGIGSAFWAIVGGLVVSAITERSGLLASIRGT